MMFSSTVRWLHRLKCWNTIASLQRMACSCRSSTALSMPSLAIVSGSGVPATEMVPLLGRSSMLMQRRKVLLPEPLEPMMLTQSPAWAVSDTPLSTWLLP